MKSPEQENNYLKTEPEQKKEEIILKIIIARHGPKLVAAGEKNLLAEYFKESVKNGFKKMDISEGGGLVHVSTSPVKRAVDTANIHSNEISKTGHRNKNHVTNKKSLEVPFQPIAEAEEERYAEDLDTIVRMQKQFEPEIRSEIAQKYPNLQGEEKEAEVRNKIDMAVLEVMFNDEKRVPDEKLFKTSYIDVADRFAKRYSGFGEHLSLLDKQKNAGKQNDEPYMQIDVSHSYLITSFLKKYLVFNDGMRAEDMDPKDFFERMGGIIRESGSMEVDYVKSDDLIIKISGEFEKGKKFEGTLNFNELK